jgi:ATP-binding cassette, subfamily B, bacterial PglK
VWHAATLAQIDSFIRSLPQGLDTRVGELGNRLSGGQRQRIGIARALYGDPSVLVLDEATSALDSETEHAIGEAIESLHGMKTLIIIAHRLTTLRKCDRLVFLKNGKIVTSGTFERLALENAEFREAVRLASLGGGKLAQAS